MSNTLLIDADVWCYLFAFRNTKTFCWDEGDEPTSVCQPDVARMEIGIFVEDLREKLNGDDVYFILSDRYANFRKELDPTYKANRKGVVKPELWAFLRDYIENGDHGFPVRQYARLEGDDVLGMMGSAPKRGAKSIVVSIDKDMKTVPCRLYLHNKPEDGVMHIDRYDAQRFHILQTLMGDPVDGYRGCPGIGVKKAGAAMAEVEDNSDLWDMVVEIYESKGYTEDDALLQARLAYILQHGDYTKGRIKLWNPKRLA